MPRRPRSCALVMRRSGRALRRLSLRIRSRSEAELSARSRTSSGRRSRTRPSGIIGCRSRTRFMQAVDRMAALEGFTFECPQVRPGGDPPLRTRGRCAAWQAGRQLSRGGGDRRRHRTPKAHGEAHRQLQARQRAPVSEVADPPLSPTRPALWRSVFGRARGRPDDEKVSPCCPIHHSTNGVVTPRLDLCGATDDLLDHARVAKAVKELGDAFLD